MVFSTDSDLSYVYLQYKSEKVYGLFGFGWKNQEHTVCNGHPANKISADYWLSTCPISNCHVCSQKHYRTKLTYPSLPCPPPPSHTSRVHLVWITLTFMKKKRTITCLYFSIKPGLSCSTIRDFVSRIHWSIIQAQLFFELYLVEEKKRCMNPFPLVQTKQLGW